MSRLDKRDPVGREGELGVRPRDLRPLDYVAFHARRTPSRLAAVELDEGMHFSYRELDDAVARCVTVLRRRGCRRGDRVSVLSKNHVGVVVLHLACARIGAVLAPLNVRLSARELDSQLTEVAPRLRVGDERLPERPPEDLGLSALLNEIANAPPGGGEPPDPDAASLLLFTSGTTGRPKGALLSERNLVETAINFSAQGQVFRQSRFLCDAPMFHVIGIVNNVRTPLLHGGAFAVSSGFEPARTLRRLMDPALGITHFFCVPQMLSALRRHPDYQPGELARLTAIFTGGASHAAADVREALRDGLTVADGYGMTEVGCVFGMPLDPELIERRAGSVGLPSPRVQIRIVDHQGRDCPPGAVGELWVRGDTVFAGYLARPAETRESFSDGWFRTGDLFTVDEDGYHILVDRKKDMFISGGENVYPAEIEAQLAGLEGLLEAAVVGVPDDTWGEVGHLVLASAPGASIGHEEVVAYLEPRLARYKLPKQVTCVDALPRTGSGKIDKVALRKHLNGGGDDRM